MSLCTKIDTCANNLHPCIYDIDETQPAPSGHGERLNPETEALSLGALTPSRLYKQHKLRTIGATGPGNSSDRSHCSATPRATSQEDTLLSRVALGDGGEGGATN